MKLSKLIFFLSIITLVSCSKKNAAIPNFTPLNTGNSGNTTPTSLKKGSDFSTNTSEGTWQGNVVGLRSSWFYTWGTLLPSDPTPQNIEFVPMLWGSGSVTTSNIDNLKQLKNQGRIKFILGFNEPNRTDQSNMSVHDALAQWPALESIGLPLGSPAADYPTRQWIYDFMDSTIAQKKRVDFICVHMYVGPDDVAFVQILQDLYNKYQKPIWITEFAVADWNATSVSTNKYSADQVLGFMQKLLPKLETLSFVQRYSWFSGSQSSSALCSSALVDLKGNLTPLGTFYANYKP